MLDTEVPVTQAGTDQGGHLAERNGSIARAAEQSRYARDNRESHPDLMGL